MISNNEKKIDLSMKIKVLDHPKNFGLLIVVVISDGLFLSFWAQAEPEPEDWAWGMTPRLDPPYRWVGPAKLELEKPFQVSSPSRAWAEPQARPITSRHQIASVMIIDQSNHVFILSKYKIVSFLLLLSRPPIIRAIIRISNRVQDFFQNRE